MDAVDQNLEVHNLTQKLRAQRVANDWGRAIEQSIWGVKGGH